MAEEELTLDRTLAARAAAYFSRERAFLGYWLDRYRESETIEPAALAAFLGCSLETLDHLATCFCPRDERFEEDTGRLASRFGLNQDRLAGAVLQAREFEAARRAGPAATRQAAASSAPVFAAASDREEGPGREPGSVEENDGR